MSKTTVNPLTSIRHVPLFAACSKKEIKLIANAVAEASFMPGVTLIEQGQPGREAFIVCKGIVSVRRHGRKIASLGAGAILGELSLLDNGLRTASVICDTEVDVLVLNQRDFKRLLDEVPSLRVSLLTTLVRRVRELGTDI